MPSALAGYSAGPNQRMEHMKYEYDTVELGFRPGILKQGLPDIRAVLNNRGKEGWQLKQVIMPSSQFGTSDSIIAILERSSE